jgi:hypothetical protein
VRLKTEAGWPQIEIGCRSHRDGSAGSFCAAAAPEYLAARCQAVDTIGCSDDNTAKTYAAGLAICASLQSSNFSSPACSYSFSQQSSQKLPATVALQGSDADSLHILWFINLISPLFARVC